MKFTNKVVVITGASSGIGKALAELFLNELEARVVLFARSEEKMLEVVNNHPNERWMIVKGDVTREEDCQRLIHMTVERFNKIDVLINNAGISMRALFEDVDLAVLKKLMDVNFWGTVYCTKFALPYLLKSRGSVVGVSSIAGYQGLPARTGYSASKFAMHGFLNTLRIETMKEGLHVMIACPGFTASNIRFSALTADGTVQGDTPLKEEKLMTPEEVARKIAKGINKRRREVIMTTQGKLTVFLGKFFPSLVDRLVYHHMKKEQNSPLK
ncbi:MAG: SDR family oxidoreductase [Bacteroidales bacterium]|nr:SDR family oxidoreductase [Bacteroidales bacterium]